MVLFALLVDQNSTPPKATALPASQVTACLPSSCAAIRGSKKFTERPQECPPISQEDSHTGLSSICQLHSLLLASHSAPNSQKGLYNLLVRNQNGCGDFQVSHPWKDWLGVSWEEDTVLQVSIGKSLYLPISSLFLSLGPCQVLSLSASRPTVTSLA